MFLSIGDFITRNVIGIIAFGIGIVIGLLLIKVSFIILGKMCKKQKAITKKIIEPVNDPKELIDSAIDNYYNNYSNLLIGKRISSAKDISLNLIKDISKCYYPDSNLSMYEIDIKTTIELTRDIVNSTNNFIDNIIDNKVFRLAWGATTVVAKAKHFFSNLFKKKEDKQDDVVYLKVNPRKMKIADVLNQLDRLTSKKDDNDTSSDNELKTKNYFIVNNLINSKLTELIAYIGDKAMDVYSNNYDGGNE